MEYFSSQFLPNSPKYWGPVIPPVPAPASLLTAARQAGLTFEKLKWTEESSGKHNIIRRDFPPYSLSYAQPGLILSMKLVRQSCWLGGDGSRINNVGFWGRKEGKVDGVEGSELKYRGMGWGGSQWRVKTTEDLIPDWYWSELSSHDTTPVHSQSSEKSLDGNNWI